MFLSSIHAPVTTFHALSRLSRCQGLLSHNCLVLLGLCRTPTRSETHRYPSLAAVAAKYVGVDSDKVSVACFSALQDLAGELSLATLASWKTSENRTHVLNVRDVYRMHPEEQLVAQSEELTHELDTPC